jgi:hypothetical protein
VYPPLTLSPLEDTFIHQKKPLEQPHSCSDCASCAKFQDVIAILQDPVFKVRKEVDDLQFRLEIMDKKETQIMQLVSSLQGTRHSPDQASSAPTALAVVLASDLQTPTVDNSAVVLDLALQMPTSENVAHNKSFA